jgi:HD-like signal output (HDOD) protein
VSVVAPAKPPPDAFGGWSRESLLTAIRGATSFPSFPDVVLRFEEELRRPEPSVAAVAGIVEQDPPLAAAVLRVANSAWYGAAREIAAVRAAVVRLGLDEMRRLVLTTAVYRRFAGYGGIDPRQFWLHSIATALLTRAIAQRSSAPIAPAAVDVAFTAGLLHDIGVLVLAWLVPDEYAELAAAIRRDGGTLCEREAARWNVDHAEAGELLARAWRLPEPIAAVVRHHHAPWLAEPAHRPVVQLVHLANFVSTNQGFGRSEEGFPEQFDDGAWTALALSHEDIPALIEDVRREGARCEQFVQLAG